MLLLTIRLLVVFFFQAEDGIRDLVRSRGLGDVYKRQAQEAVTLYRAQAEQNPAYQPDLAMALNNLAIRLAATGDRAGALPPAQEAVTLRRAQAEQLSLIHI